MISLFRDFAKSKWAAGLFVLLILSFLIVGGSQTDIFRNLGPKHIITAGDRSVDVAQFRAEFERVRTGMQQEAGRPVTNEDLVKENVHIRYLEGQTNRLGFLNWAHKAGIRVSEELILKRIREIPAFFNQVTGQFDQAQYEQALSAQNVTPVMLEDEQLKLHEAIEDEVLLALPLIPLAPDTTMPAVPGAPAAQSKSKKPQGKTKAPRISDNSGLDDSRPNPFLALKGQLRKD